MNRELSVEPEAVERISRLPISRVAAQVLEVTRDQRVPLQSLADAIATDAALAARLVRVVNWAPGVISPVASVSQAIAELGVENIKSMVLGLSVFPFDTPEDEWAGFAGQEYPVTPRQLWEHMLGCAIVSGNLAVYIDPSFAQQAFAGGLLHDIGRVLLYRHWRANFFEALTVAREKQLPPAEAETLALGRNHLEIGALWAHTNGLNPFIGAAIGQHHLVPVALGDLDERQRKFVALVQLADLLCEAHDVGKGCDSGPIKDELWEILELGQGDWHGRLEAVKCEVEMSRPLFHAQTHNQRAEALPVREARAAAQHKETKRKARVIPFPVRPPAPADQPANGHSRKLTILIVEDHGSLCDMLSLYFMRYGYHVRTASDGENALTILDSEDVHLVLLDLMLPRIDGFAVLRQIRERGEGKHPYVIVVSAGASTKDRSRVLELGANEYMPKPFHLMRLLERIQNVEKYLLR